MIIVIARLEVEPAALPQIRPALDRMMRATWEESGCLSYSIAIEDAAAGVVTIVERWRDDRALAEHFGSAHMTMFNAATAGLVRALDARVYDVSGERPLMAVANGSTAA